MFAGRGAFLRITAIPKHTIMAAWNSARNPRKFIATLDGGRVELNGRESSRKKSVADSITHSDGGPWREAVRIIAGETLDEKVHAANAVRVTSDDAPWGSAFRYSRCECQARPDRIQAENISNS